jgi:NDP-sugar pyrophosphorylase family protein
MKRHVRTAVILAGGLGLRLRPLTEDRPKVMIEVAGRPIAEWQVEWLRRNGIEQVVFAAGYRWERIRAHFKEGADFGVRVDYSVEEEPLGTGGAIKKALAGIEEDAAVVVNGDIFTDLNLRAMEEAHFKNKAKGTLLLVPFISPYGVIEFDREGRVRAFQEKPVIKGTYINGGVYLLSRQLLEALPDKGDIERTTFPQLAAEGELRAYLHHGFWRAIDTVKDLKQLDEELRRGAMD